MTQIHLDPVRIRMFERKLEELQKKCANRRSLTQQQVDEIRGFWNDEKYDIFRRKQEKFNEDVYRLERRLEDFRKYLSDTANSADKYLSR